MRQSSEAVDAEADEDGERCLVMDQKAARQSGERCLVLGRTWDTASYHESLSEDRNQRLRHVNTMTIPEAAPARLLCAGQVTDQAAERRATTLTLRLHSSAGAVFAASRKEPNGAWEH